MSHKALLIVFAVLVQSSCRVEETDSSTRSQGAGVVKSESVELLNVGLQNVYRFFAKYNGRHYYTSDSAERESWRKIPGFVDEGAAFSMSSSGRQPLFRCHKPTDHMQFLSTSPLCEDVPGMENQGVIGFYNPDQPELVRFHSNSPPLRHLTTSNEAEIAILKESQEWTYEGRLFQKMEPTVSIDEVASTCKPSRNASDFELRFEGGAEPIWKHGALNSATTPKIVPDSPARSYRLNDNICTLIPHFDLGLSCSKGDRPLTSPAAHVYESPFNERFPDYDYKNWITAPYIENGVIHALAHSEWYECLVKPDNDYCKQPTGLAMGWSNAITQYRSDSGGSSWRRVKTVRQPEAPLPKAFENIYSNGEMTHHGYFHPSNILKINGSYYAFVTQVVRNEESAEVEFYSPKLLRTDSLKEGEWETLPMPGLPTSRSFDHVSMSYNTSLCKFVINSWNSEKGGGQWGYILTDDLQKTEWGTFKAFSGQDSISLPGPTFSGLPSLHYAAYASGMWDSDSKGDNFEFTDEDFYIFASSLDMKDVGRRNLYRIKVTVTPEEGKITP